MSQINVQNLTFYYDGNPAAVFENVSFSIDTNWKLGFVGRNGRGKTTLLNLLLGKYEYSGKISSDAKFVYFPFNVRDKSRLSLEVMQEICPAEDWEIIRELSYLSVGAEALYRPFDSLSYGEQTKLLIAGLFLNEGGFMLIDEPTNHLDATAREIVAEYLRNKKSYIVVSHDRAFLDRCADHILSINKTNIEIRSGNFSSWLENFQRQQNFEATQSEQLKKDISRLSEASKRTSVWADKTEASKIGKNSAGLRPDKGYIGHKAAKLMKSAKVTQARQTQAIEQKSMLLRNAETNEKLKLHPLEFRSEKLLDVSGLELKYSNIAICQPITFEVLRGERIVLDGQNGCGKSSLLKLLTGENIAYSGALSLSSGLKISYIPQTTEGLCGKLRDFAKENGLDESLFMAVLSKMDLDKKYFGNDLSSLSEGQKKKVLIAKSLCENAHLYIWDEPLNYIDIYSRLQIENLIKEFKPTMIFVEHDKMFRQTIATKIVKIFKTLSK